MQIKQKPKFEKFCHKIIIVYLKKKKKLMKIFLLINLSSLNKFENCVVNFGIQ